MALPPAGHHHDLYIDFLLITQATCSGWKNYFLSLFWIEAQTKVISPSQRSCRGSLEGVQGKPTPDRNYSFKMHCAMTQREHWWPTHVAAMT